MIFWITLLNIFLDIKVNFTSLASELCFKNNYANLSSWGACRNEKQGITYNTAIKKSCGFTGMCLLTHAKSILTSQFKMHKTNELQKNTFLCIKYLLETVDNLTKSNDFLSVLEWTVKSPSEILTFTQSWAAELESPYNSWRLLIPKEKQP